MPEAPHDPTSARPLHRHVRLREAIKKAFHLSDADLAGPYARAAGAWVAFSRPDLADNEAPDALALARHTVLLGFDDRYYSCLLRLFLLLGMDDR